VTLEVWFDFASPYSYLAVTRLPALARGVTITWRPFLLGPIFSERGWTTSPFVLFPDKGRHMWRDVEREAAHFGIPFAKPSMFPVRSTLAACVALVAIDDGFIETFARDVYAAHYVRDLDISRDDVIDGVLGANGPAIRARAMAPETKARLRASVGRAKELGIFGAPSFVVGDELFWGNDRLERALEYARTDLQ
jgi:2-hydroxychromene-2-carboxylate isomerase